MNNNKNKWRSHLVKLYLHRVQIFKEHNPQGTESAQCFLSCIYGLRPKPAHTKTRARKHYPILNLKQRYFLPINLLDFLEPQVWTMQCVLVTLHIPRLKLKESSWSTKGLTSHIAGKCKDCFSYGITPQHFITIPSSTFPISKYSYWNYIFQLRGK